jgi:MraZ protein
VNGFVGQYEHQMDEKGRVSLPSAFRRGRSSSRRLRIGREPILESDSGRFVLLQWEKPYLTLFPESKWVSVQERLLEYRRNDPRAWNQVRLIVSNAVEVSPDKQGRILVPAGLQDAAELSGTVLLSGNIDRVELWNPSTYAEAVQQDAGDLEQFAHNLFG